MLGEPDAARFEKRFFVDDLPGFGSLIQSNVVSKPNLIAALPASSPDYRFSTAGAARRALFGFFSPLDNRIACVAIRRAGMETA